MKLYLLDNGWMECDANRMVNHTTIATANNKNARHQWIKIPTWSLLIEHPKAGYVIYDFSRSPDEDLSNIAQRTRELFPYFCREEQRLENQLSAVGVTTRDIKTAVLSHFHFDHMGNAPLFTHCEVYAPGKDFEQAVQTTHRDPDIEKHGSYVKKYVDLTFKKLHLVDEGEDVELFDGVTALNLPGHTPGLLGLLVRLKNSGTFIFPSDAIYTAKNYGPPALASGNFYDSLSFFASIEKVRALQKKHDAKVIFSHDMDFFSTLKKAPEFYD